MRFLDLVRPVIPYLPGVVEPEKPVKFNDKLIYTTWVLFVYLLMCQIPLYGIVRKEGADPLYWIRAILAS